MEMRGRFSIAAKRMSRSVIRELLKLTSRPGLISFAGGLPYPGGFPVAGIREICDRVLSQSPQVALQYSATEGLPELRDLLVGFLSRHGLEVAREELIVTSASQQSLDLVGKIFLDRGDTVITENPSYLGALSAFRSYGVRFLPVEMDEQGLRTDLLARELKELKSSAGSGEEYFQNMPKFIYTIPDFQNPTGVTLSLARRRELLEVAAEYDLLIVEDVPYKWLRFAGEDLPMLGALERESAGGGRRVIGLYTFSKILSPGLRLGWVTADPAVIDKFVQAKQAVDLCTSSLSQSIAAEFLKSGELEGAIRQNRQAYARKARGHAGGPRAPDAPPAGPVLDRAGRGHVPLADPAGAPGRGPDVQGGAGGQCGLRGRLGLLPQRRRAQHHAPELLLPVGRGDPRGNRPPGRADQDLRAGLSAGQLRTAWPAARRRSSGAGFLRR